MATAGRAGGGAGGIDWRCCPGRGCCAGTTGGAYEEAAGAAAGGAGASPTLSPPGENSLGTAAAAEP